MIRRLRARALRAGHWVLARPLIARMVPPDLVDRFRRRFSNMGADDVLEVLAALERSQVQVWVAGGWGVDALLGEQTRAHKDLDLVVEDTGQGALERAWAALVGEGYRQSAEVEGGHLLPERLLARDGAGRKVDLLLASDVIAAHADRGFAMGTIRGQPVPCLSAELQLELHEGYELSDAQRCDVALLCHRFNLSESAEH